MNVCCHAANIRHFFHSSDKKSREKEIFIDFLRQGSGQGIEMVEIDCGDDHERNINGTADLRTVTVVDEFAVDISYIRACAIVEARVLTVTDITARAVVETATALVADISTTAVIETR